MWLRQRRDAVVGHLREYTDELSLLERTGAPITADGAYVCLDIDTFVMDNSGTKKVNVSGTYQGVDGYTPIAAYLAKAGTSVWNCARASSTTRQKPTSCEISPVRHRATRRRLKTVLQEIMYRAAK